MVRLGYVEFKFDEQKKKFQKSKQQNLIIEMKKKHNDRIFIMKTIKKKLEKL